MSGDALAETTEEPLPERFGRHRVIRLLGRGAMGSVYEAEHEDLHKRVAIKTMHGPDVDHPERKERFLREGRAASKVHHAHAIDVYDVGIEGKTAYLVMEFLDGEDLEALLARAVALPVETTLDLLLPVLAAVSAAHDAGVVHRDLKPANIFLARTADGPHPKVVDFGISKLFGEEGLALTASAAILGTPYYLAPEQLEGAKFTDARSDQWALSVILYECLAGRRPFEADSLMTLLWQIGQGELKPLRELRPEVPAGLEAAVLRGLSRKPGERHPSVRALGAAVLPFAGAEARARWSRTFGAASSHPTISSPDALGETLPPVVGSRVTPMSASDPAAKSRGSSVPSLSESVREVPPAETDSVTPPRPARRARGGVIAALGVSLGVLIAGGVMLRARGGRPAQVAQTAPVTVVSAPEVAAPQAVPTPPPIVAAPATVVAAPTPTAHAGAVADAGITAVATEATPAGGRRRHRSRREREESAGTSATTSVNGAPVLPVFPQ